LLTISIVNGVAQAAESEPSVTLRFAAGAPVWKSLLAAVPPPHYTAFGPLMMSGRLTFSGDSLRFAQYASAIARMIELLRPEGEPHKAPSESPPAPGTFDSPVGRYIHLDIDGNDYRIYFEEAGKGIPVLLQHTAGCHGSQWRHLFECRAITDRFRLIAYDLPFHGKSLPPVGVRWWSEPYQLTAAFARAVPVALSSALGLDRPVFMGCSIGGVLALDLACHHPDIFRAVISLEGALKIEHDIRAHAALWHPQVSNEYKARAMEALMAPGSPEALRKETSMVYAAGWPPLFLGDLQYYMVEYDTRSEASKVDTRQVAVHILSGAYDFSSTPEMGSQAHTAIAGSTHTTMPDLGHFPMSENPARFLDYLLPVLDSISG
jgi:pimeloyl-ACP methyl ester carboxylesterase